MVSKPGILGVFAYMDDLLAALRALKEAKLAVQAVYSPLRREEIQEAMGPKPSVIRIFTLVGGVLGGISLVSLATYAHLRWKLDTGGKPVLPWIPWVVVFFEGLILFAVLSTVISMVFKGRMPRRHPPKGYDFRFSHDRFGIHVSCPEVEFERVSKILKESGAEEVHEIEE